MMRVSASHLYRLRNHIPIATVICDHLKLPTKHREGFLRFVCPDCGEFNTAINPSTNLARCFTCARNFNTIDMLMRVQKLSFINAVNLLSSMLND
jgi:DNA primase